MTGRGKKEEDFVEALTADLAGEVLEDEEAMAEELEEIGPELEGMIARTQELAQKAVGRRRRELLRASGAGTVRRAESQGAYEGYSRAKLVEAALRKARESGGEATVQHREFQEMSEQDLRSLLEEWDEAEAEDRGDS